MSDRARLLILDEDKEHQEILRNLFGEQGYEVESLYSADSVIDVLLEKKVPVVLCDISMLSSAGAAVIQLIKEQRIPTAFILMSGMGSLDGAMAAAKHGAFDYISKSLSSADLLGIVSRALKHAQSLDRPVVKVAVSTPPDSTPRVLVGRSSKMIEVYKQIARASLSSSTVLIYGESGTGKELVARAIHENSARKDAPFVAVNCGAIVDTLLESELFGYVRGAFTGALQDKRGLFEEANGGTLFLDEIGDITPALQVKLLRVLQEREFRPVGTSKSKKVDVRIVAATHRNLTQFVKEERFREDLYYRLNVLRIDLPPLRDRLEDLPDLVGHFMMRIEGEGKADQVSPELFEVLERFPWPGNVRQLENSIESAIRRASGQTLFPEDLPEEILRFVRSSEPEALPEAPPQVPEPPLSQRLEDLEKSHIEKVLSELNFNVSKAAMALGIDRTTLYRKTKQYGIDVGRKK